MTHATKTHNQIETINTAVENLRCKECGEEYPLEAKHICEDVCFGPLEVKYNYEKLSQIVSRATIEAGPKSIWRYRHFLPVVTDNFIDVGTGMTPLVKSERLARRLGLKNLYIKNDAVNMPCLLYTSPSPRDISGSRMPSSA